jgi:hypothetical protein
MMRFFLYWLQRVIVVLAVGFVAVYAAHRHRR